MTTIDTQATVMGQGPSDRGTGKTLLAVLAGHTVTVVQMTPEHPADEDGYCFPIRSLQLCQKMAAVAARLPGVLWAEYSRSQVHVVTDLPTGTDVWRYIIDYQRAGIRVDLDGFVETNPLRWYESFRSTEKIARQALDGRHQCERRQSCLCDLRGNEKTWDGVNHFGVRGGLFGPGAVA